MVVFISEDECLREENEENYYDDIIMCIDLSTTYTTIESWIIYCSLVSMHNSLFDLKCVSNRNWPCEEAAITTCVACMCADRCNRTVFDIPRYHVTHRHIRVVTARCEPAYYFRI